MAQLGHRSGSPDQLERTSDMPNVALPNGLSFSVDSPSTITHGRATACSHCAKNPASRPYDIIVYCNGRGDRSPWRGSQHPTDVGLWRPICQCRLEDLELGWREHRQFTAMRTLSKDLEDVLRILQSAEQSPNNTQVSSEANSILQLSNECADVTKELLEGLRQLGLSGTSGKRGAVKAAFKQVWNGGEIKALDAQLEKFWSQLTLRLLISMRYNSPPFPYCWKSALPNSKVGKVLCDQVARLPAPYFRAA